MFRALSVLASFTLISLLSGSVTAADWGNFSGTLVLDGAVPVPKPVVITKDQEVCGKHGLVDESLVVNKDNKGIANVIVTLYTTAGDKVPVHESYEATANAKVRIDNENCRFNPRILTVRTSQTLLIGNLDSVGHNANLITTSIENPPANPLIPSGGVVPHKFNVPERYPVTVRCAIHPWMGGKLVVKDHPYMAVTDADGKFEIKNLPAGNWTFHFWHEAMGHVDTGKLDGKKVKWKKGRVKQKIAKGDNKLGTLAISAKEFK